MAGEEGWELEEGGGECQYTGDLEECLTQKALTSP